MTEAEGRIQTPATGVSALLAVLLTSSSVVMILAAQQQHTFPVLVAAALAVGALQLAAWKLDAWKTGFILAVAAVLRLLAFPTPPVLSDDMYRYVWDGWVVLEGMNPYAFLPSDAMFRDWHEGELFCLLNSPDFHSVYPPVTQLFFAAGALLGREVPLFASIPGPEGAWWGSWMGIKALFTAAELGGLFMLSRLVRPRTLLLVALSPVLLIAGSLQGHTDVLLLPLLAAGVASWKKGKWGAAVFWVTVAGWVKLVPLVMLPFLILGASTRWPTRFRLTAWVALVSVAVWLPFAAAYVPANISDSLRLYVAWFEFNAGPYYLVKEWYEFRTGADWSKQIGPAFREIYLGVVVLLGVAALARSQRLRFVLDDVAEKRASGVPAWWAWKMGYGAWALYLVFSTTVHPWYLVGVLILGAVLFENRIPWHWFILSVVSVATYLLYSHGQAPYWWAVRTGWGVWFVVWAWQRSPAWLQAVLAWRADAKYGMIRRWVGPGESVLDVGGGEGYLAWRRATDTHFTTSPLDPGRDVAVAEVRPSVNVPVQNIQYDGLVLPVDDSTYDVVVMTYVLHHAASPSTVLEEALRVARHRVIVLESTYRWGWEHALLRRLDVLANRLRSVGRTPDGSSQPDGLSPFGMNEQEAHLQHRTDRAWVELASRMGACVVACRPIWRPLHRQFLFVTVPNDAKVERHKPSKE